MSYWDHDTTFTFLELYKNHPCIWDPEHKHYKNKKRNYEAWIDIAENIAIDCSVEELKKKKESLMSAYRINKVREQSGEGNKIVWFAFSYMDSFLGPIYDKKPSSKNVKNEDRNTTYYDQDDTRSTIEFETDETSAVESPPQHEYSIQSTSKARPRKRRYNDPLQLTEGRDQRSMNKREETFTEEEVLQEIHIPDDECATFGTLVAQKLRKLSDERRDIMMVKINQLFVDERQNNVSNEPNLKT